MSSDALPPEEREEQLDPPPPVKKRGRYAQTEKLPRPIWNTGAAGPSEAVEPLEGFVRYELDEEDSEEDPDFDADVLDEDEDDDDPDDIADDVFSQSVRDGAQQADAELSHILRGGRIQNVHNTSYQNVLPHAPFVASQEVFHENAAVEAVDPNPHFDVDDLDSTDDENLAHSGVSTAQRDFSRVYADVLQPDDEDEVQDVDDADLEEADEGDTDEADGETDTGPAEDYIKFLLGLGEGDEDKVGLPSSEGYEHRPVGGSANTASAPKDSAHNLGGDDDDDFDYLRESARIQDDPLEYRDDLHVSRKELVQLLYNSKESILRRHTRKSRKRQLQAPKRPRSPTLQSALPVGANLFGQAMGGVPVSNFGAHQNAAVASMPPSGQMPSTAPVLHSVPTPPVASYGNLTSQVLSLFHEQLSTHVQILANLYAVNKQKVRESEQRGHVPTENSNSPENSSAAEAVQRSEVLLRGLIENRRISSLYHQTLSTNISRLKTFADRMLQRNRSSCFAYQSCRSSIYSVPIMNHLEAFMQDCDTTPVQHMPDGALSRLRSFFRADIINLLSRRPNQRQYSASGLRPGWFVWTAQDDTLLAMTMAKYGSEVGQFSADLLPHRQENDCQTRVRYLSSRRCPDNPVKRQAMYIAAPLNQGELALVTRGLELYGNGGAPDENVWREIQRNLLPNREWSHLQKLWSWRETRRKYKAKYRAKAIEKKRALREATARA